MYLYLTIFIVLIKLGKKVLTLTECWVRPPPALPQPARLHPPAPAGVGQVRGPRRPQERREAGHGRGGVQEHPREVLRLS